MVRPEERLDRKAGGPSTPRVMSATRAQRLVSRTVTTSMDSRGRRSLNDDDDDWTSSRTSFHDDT